MRYDHAESFYNYLKEIVFKFYSGQEVKPEIEAALKYHLCYTNFSYAYYRIIDVIKETTRKRTLLRSDLESIYVTNEFFKQGNLSKDLRILFLKTIFIPILDKHSEEQAIIATKKIMSICSFIKTTTDSILGSNPSDQNIIYIHDDETDDYIGQPWGDEFIHCVLGGNTYDRKVIIPAPNPPDLIEFF